LQLTNISNLKLSVRHIRTFEKEHKVAAIKNSGKYSSAEVCTAVFTFTKRFIAYI